MSGRKTALQAHAFDPSIPPPKHLDLSNKANYRENLETFKFSWSNYAVASGLDALRESDQMTRFTIALGYDGQQMLLKMDIKESDRISPDTILAAMAKKLCGPVNMRFDRMKFNQSKQKPGESYEEYFARLLVLVKRCRFGDTEEEFLLDHILASILDKGLRKRMSESKSLSLQRAMEWCKNSEKQRNERKKMQSENSKTPIEEIPVLPLPVQMASPSAPSFYDLTSEYSEPPPYNTMHYRPQYVPTKASPTTHTNAYRQPDANSIYEHTGFSSSIYPNLPEFKHLPPRPPSIVCQLCGKDGHVANNCPKKKCTIM